MLLLLFCYPLFLKVDVKRITMFLALCSYHFNALEEKIVLSVKKKLLINFVLNFVLFRHIFLLSCKTLDYLLKRKQLTAIIYRLNFDLLLSSDCLQVPKEQWLEVGTKASKSQIIQTNWPLVGEMVF